MPILKENFTLSQKSWHGYDIESSASVAIEFEVYCGTCNEGLCSNTRVRESRSRGMPQVVVDVCESCTSKLEMKVEELEKENAALVKQIDDMYYRKA